MNASDLIKGFIKLGVAVKDAVSKNQSGNKTDWDAVLKSLTGDADVKTTLTTLVGALKSGDAGKAIGEVDAKQQAILKGRSVAQLEHAELMQYVDLADARMLLATQQLTAAMDPTILQWLVDDALPTLVDIAPVVIPLLL